VHRNKFLCNKTNRRTNFPNLFLSRNSTRFGHRNCPKRVEFLEKNKYGRLVRLLVLLRRNTNTECVCSKARSWGALCSCNTASTVVGNMMMIMVILACNSQGRSLYVLNFHPPPWSSIHLLLPCSIHTAVCASSSASGRILVCGSSQTKLSRKFH